MLSISRPIHSAVAATKYFFLELEKAGQLYGDGALLLGLKGEVSRNTFKNFLNGFFDDEGHKLVQNAGRENPKSGERFHQCGWDGVFSPDKSVSTLHALASDDVKRGIEDDHESSLRVGLKHWEAIAGFTRRGKHGKIKEKASLVFAIFTHYTSRANDPHLHSHVVIFNFGVRKDGTTGALWSRDFFRARIAIGMIYQTEFAARLKQRFGLEIETTNNGFRLAEVPIGLCKEFSKRREQIESVMAKEGVRGAKAARRVAKQTRPSKSRISKEELFALWSESAKAQGWTEEKVGKIIQPKVTEQFNAVRKSGVDKETVQGAAASEKRGDNKSSINGERKRPSLWIPKAQKARQGSEHDSEKQQIPLEPLSTEEKNNGEENKRSQLKKAFVRIEWRPLFPTAPFWSPAKKLKTPYIAIGTPTRSHNGWDKVLWRKDLFNFELRIQKRAVFSGINKWHPLSSLRVPAARFVRWAGPIEYLIKSIKRGHEH